MANNIEQETAKLNRPFQRLKDWVAFFVSVFMLWIFVFYAGPWIRDSIPIMKRMTQVAEERDIDTTAFFYSENKEFYEAERSLRESMELSKPRGYGFDRFLFLGIFSCFAILAIGFVFMAHIDGSKKNRFR